MCDPEARSQIGRAGDTYRHYQTRGTHTGGGAVPVKLPEEQVGPCLVELKKNQLTFEFEAIESSQE